TGNTSDTFTVEGPVDLDWVKPGNRFAVIYGKLIRAEINTPNSGRKPVKLFRPVGPNSLVDGDDVYDGPCEVCHTKTRHHRNNDDNPEQADHRHNVGMQCTFCHKHVNGFKPLGAGAHAIHVVEEYGPKITCAQGQWGCHGSYDPGSNYPNEVYFADGEVLCDGRVGVLPRTSAGPPCPNTGPDTGTRVCANCHGEGAVLAKYYFFRPGSSEGGGAIWVTPQSGEYTWADTWLGELGEARFCGSCHNDSPNPPPVAGPKHPTDKNPPNVVGDLDLQTGANSYGFFVNGHGKSSAENYERLSWQDSSASGNPGAGRICSDCHEYTKTHWNNPDPNKKRLKDGYDNDADNTVCRKCHNNEGGPVWANNGPEWYRSDDYANFRNSAHGPGIPGDKGNLRCTMCHDPHGVVKQDLAGNGALNPAMTKGYQQELCFRCHSDNGDLMQVKNDQISNNRPGGHVSADDIEEAFTLADGHDLGTPFTNGGKNYTLECVSCHNVHVVTGKYWDAEQNLSPVALPLGGFEVWGDDPEEKMDYYARTGGSGTGGFYWQIANGKQLGDTAMIWNWGGMYQPPKSGGGLNFEFGGDVLPAYPKFCLTCHSERVSPANPPVNWGQGIGCTDNTVDPPNQRIECGARHGFGIAGTPFNKNEDNPATSGFWGSSGNPDAIFNMNFVTRGRGGGHFMRWPYDSASRNAGANFVLSCTDCHEAHRSRKSSMIRERWQVTAAGDCGSGGDGTPETAGENCGADGGNWREFCNSCHYFYGGHHGDCGWQGGQPCACGNASCHEVNSIHRIIHSGADSGSGTRLEITSMKTDPNDGIPYREDFEPPSFTPEIKRVDATVGSNQLTVFFRSSQHGAEGRRGVYGSVDVTDLTVDSLSGALEPEDFWLIDKNNDNPRTITAVSHSPGMTTAVLTMSAPLTAADLNTDTLSARPTSIWGWYEGGYNNYATGVMGPQVVSAGPWPVALTGDCPNGKTVFNFGEPAGSASVTDDQGIMQGVVNNPAVAIPGDGLYHGDKLQGTAIDFDNNLSCLVSPAAFTMEARVKFNSVDIDYADDGNGGDLNPDVTTTQQRIFERRRTVQFTVMRGDWMGDNVPARAGKARAKIRYRVDAKHACPDLVNFPNDPDSTEDKLWSEVFTDIDRWPIVANHWYRIKFVFNSMKTPGDQGIAPVDIWLDDQGPEGDDAGEAWAGYVNATVYRVSDYNSCAWGPLGGDFGTEADENAAIGDNLKHMDQGVSDVQMLDGLIDWLSWSPDADYSGVDDPAHLAVP
ncbi:MAG TPA: hypothetical protein ENI99_06625, partial [Sedimenticola sp.]|nr:hypothetical protein [Sedimenticola sp.]